MNCRFLRLPELRGRGGQEALLPHVRGRGQGPPSKRRRSRIRRRFQQAHREALGRRRPQNQVSNICSAAFFEIFIFIFIKLLRSFFSSTPNKCPFVCQTLYTF